MAFQHHRFGATAAVALIALSLAGNAPPFSGFQGASTLPPGRVGVTPSGTTVDFRRDGETSTTGSVVGVQVAVGFTSHSELRGGYARTNPEDGSGVNLVGLGPKVALVPDRVAVYMPVGFALSEGRSVRHSLQWHPTVMVTQRVSRHVELNPSAKAIVPLSAGGDVLLAFNMGLGLSSNLERWALRPEAGIRVDPGSDGAHISYGLGLSVNGGR